MESRRVIQLQTLGLEGNTSSESELWPLRKEGMDEEKKWDQEEAQRRTSVS